MKFFSVLDVIGKICLT